jgi:hypothetical protein
VAASAFSIEQPAGKMGQGRVIASFLPALRFKILNHIVHRHKLCRFFRALSISWLFVKLSGFLLNSVSFQNRIVIVNRHFVIEIFNPTSLGDCSAAVDKSGRVPDV